MEVHHGAMVVGHFKVDIPTTLLISQSNTTILTLEGFDPYLEGLQVSQLYLEGLLKSHNYSAEHSQTALT
jgi:hypothetical protein